MFAIYVKFQSDGDHVSLQNSLLVAQTKNKELKKTENDSIYFHIMIQLDILENLIFVLFFKYNWVVGRHTLSLF